jgi:hypothetical protein
LTFKPLIIKPKDKGIYLELFLSKKQIIHIDSRRKTDSIAEMSTNTAFDYSLKRYENESFKNTNAKQVPHEELDFKIYKANSVTFSTTEICLP